MKSKLFLVLLLCSSASLADEPYKDYDVRDINVVDGDTVKVDIGLGFGVYLDNESVRIYNLDTPEVRTRDLEEKKYGLLSKARMEELLSNNHVVLRHYYEDKGKFGRVLGDFVLDDGRSVSQIMKDECMGVPYLGQNKNEIRGLHLLNRLCLINR